MGVTYADALNQLAPLAQEPGSLKDSDFRLNISLGGTYEIFDGNLRKNRLDVFLGETRLQADQKHPYRYFPCKDTHILLGVPDFYAMGLDTARAVAAILHFYDKKLFDSQRDSLFKILSAFQNKMSRFKTDSVGRESAYKELKAFNGALRSLLMQNGIFKKTDHANNAIRLIRDMQLRLMFASERQVMEVGVPVFRGEEGSARRASGDGEVLTPVAASTKVSRNRVIQENRNISLAKPEHANNPWFNYDLKLWYNELMESLGIDSDDNWFTCFIEANPDVKVISPAPMIRRLPGPANISRLITRCETNGFELNLQQVGVAITEPFQIDDQSERERITVANHRELFAREKALKRIIREHFERWGSLMDDGLTLPIVYQTLLANGVLASSDYGKSKTTLTSKEQANIVIQHELNQMWIYYCGDNDIRFFNEEPKPQELPDGVRRIHFKLIDINQCVNIHELLSVTRNCDKEGPAELVGDARSILVKLNTKLPSPQQVMLIDILTLLEPCNKDYPSKDELQRLKNNVTKLSKWLLSPTPESCNVSLKTRTYAALLLQAAFELKCCLNEGSAIWRLKTLRQSEVRAMYTGLVAQLTGAYYEGCMGRLDRTLHLDAHITGLFVQFVNEGRILAHDATREEVISFNKNYCSTEAQHNLVKVATGSPITKMSETESLVGAVGQALELESQDERKLSKKYGKTREVQFDDVSFREYLAMRQGAEDFFQVSPPAGQDPSSPDLSAASTAERRSSGEDTPVLGDGSPRARAS